MVNVLTEEELGILRRVGFRTAADADQVYRRNAVALAVLDVAEPMLLDTFEEFRSAETDSEKLDVFPIGGWTRLAVPPSLNPHGAPATTGSSGP